MVRGNNIHSTQLLIVNRASQIFPLIYPLALYSGEQKGLYVLPSRTQAWPGSAVKQEEEDNSRNHLQACTFQVDNFPSQGHDFTAHSLAL